MLELFFWYALKLLDLSARYATDKFGFCVCNNSWTDAVGSDPLTLCPAGIQCHADTIERVPSEGQVAGHVAAQVVRFLRAMIVLGSLFVQC